MAEIELIEKDKISNMKSNWNKLSFFRNYCFIWKFAIKLTKKKKKTEPKFKSVLF